MSCSETQAVTNDKAACQLYSIKLGFTWSFGYWFFEDKEKQVPIDITNISYELRVFFGDNTSALKILNSEWARPEVHRIQKVYNPFTNSDLAPGNYTYELVATYPNGMILPILLGDIIVY